MTVTPLFHHLERRDAQGQELPDRNDSALDVVSMGRVGVDLYPLQSGVPLQQVTSFGRFLGGSAANVAVAAARLGRRSALIAGIGDDPFADFITSSLRAWGVDVRFLLPHAGSQTPLTFCELFPPESFPLHFHRGVGSPDLAIASHDLDLDALRRAPVLWYTLTGLSDEPSRSAHGIALETRARAGHTVLDLDYRAQFWDSAQEARAAAKQALEQSTIAVGNLHECQVATGRDDPTDAAKALLDAGVEMAVVKLGSLGSMAVTSHEMVRLPAQQVQVVNGLGAGDAFGGALCHGLLSQWPLRRILEFANAAGALVAAQLPCADAMPTEADVHALIATRSPVSSFDSDPSHSDRIARTTRSVP